MCQMQIIFEHHDFIVVSKPTSVTMHYADGDKPILALLEKRGYLGLSLVHRLDTDTSGLLLLARNPTAATAFSDLFKHKAIAKFYLAISDKKPLKKQGHIIGDMKKVRDGNYALARSMENPAYTQFISDSIKIGSDKPYRLFILKPHTGKTHQLRVALKSIGAPILGDKRYAKSTADRMYLHAWMLKFEYLGKSYQFESMPTEGVLFNSIEFKQHLAMLSMPWEMPWPASKKIPSSNV